VKFLIRIIIAFLILASCIGPTPTISPIPSPLPSPLEAPCTPTATSKVGLHIVPGRRTGFGTFLQRLVDACVNLSVVKAVDDLSPLREVERLMPATITVGRLNTAIDPATGVTFDLQAFKPGDFHNSAREAADVYWYLAAPIWLRFPEVNAWELFNEYSPDPGSPEWGWQSSFFIQMMMKADEAGLKLVLYAFSAGNPPLNEATIAEITPALRYAMAHGHYLSVHEYGGVASGDPDTLRGSILALRYRQLYAALPTDARPRLIVSEAGQAGGYEFIGVQPFIEDYAWYSARLAEDDYVVGVAAWTLGNWGNANFQDALPALADYLIRLETPAPLLDRFIYLPVTSKAP